MPFSMEPTCRAIGKVPIMTIHGYTNPYHKQHGFWGIEVTDMEVEDARARKSDGKKCQ